MAAPGATLKWVGNDTTAADVHNYVVVVSHINSISGEKYTLSVDADAGSGGSTPDVYAASTNNDVGVKLADCRFIALKASDTEVCLGHLETDRLLSMDMAGVVTVPACAIGLDRLMVRDRHMDGSASHMTPATRFTLTAVDGVRVTLYNAASQRYLWIDGDGAVGLSLPDDDDAVAADFALMFARLSSICGYTMRNIPMEYGLAPSPSIPFVPPTSTSLRRVDAAMIICDIPACRDISFPSCLQHNMLLRVSGGDGAAAASTTATCPTNGCATSVTTGTRSCNDCAGSSTRVLSCVLDGRLIVDKFTGLAARHTAAAAAATPYVCENVCVLHCTECGVPSFMVTADGPMVMRLHSDVVRDRETGVRLGDSVYEAAAAIYRHDWLCSREFGDASCLDRESVRLHLGRVLPTLQRCFGNTPAKDYDGMATSAAERAAVAQLRTASAARLDADTEMNAAMTRSITQTVAQYTTHFLMWMERARTYDLHGQSWEQQTPVDACGDCERYRGGHIELACPVHKGFGDHVTDATTGEWHMTINPFLVLYIIQRLKRAGHSSNRDAAQRHIVEPIVRTVLADYSAQRLERLVVEQEAYYVFSHCE